MKAVKSLLLVLGAGVLAALGYMNRSALVRYLDKEQWQGEPHSVAIVSITTDPDNLWDPEKGIYVLGNHNNYLQSGTDWEREGQLKFYENDGRLGFESKVGLRMHGNNMRSMAQKPWRIYFKDVRGKNERLKYPVFGEEGGQWFDSLVLRVGDSQLTMIRDWLAAELVGRSSSLDRERVRPVAMYLNGEYWGLYLLQERFDEAYFFEKYRIKPKFLSIVEVPLNSGDNKGRAVATSEAEKPEVERYNQLLAAVAECGGCMSYEELNQQASGDNLIDYLIFELYFDNLDWPYNNIKAWRYKKEPTEEGVEEGSVLDGRFRWLFFDLDVGFGAATDMEEKMTAEAQVDPYKKLSDDAFMFKNMFYDNDFRRKYLKRTTSLLKGVLKEEEAVAVVDKLAEEIRPEMEKQIERWGGVVSDNGTMVVESMEEWEKRVELLKVYLRVRSIGFLTLTEDFFKQVDSLRW